MLVGTQLKLFERRSGQRINRYYPCTNSVVMRQCILRNVTEEPAKILTVPQVPEKRSPELRVVSLNLKDELCCNLNQKIKRSPHRMPLFCSHFKRIQKIYHRDEKDLDDDLIVRGFEVRTGSGNSNTLQETDTLLVTDAHEDEYKYLPNGIQIQLTDCCQCVCDLFNSDFKRSHDDHDFGFVTMDSCNSFTSPRPKEVALTSKNNNILDPNILKVIRITMNTKN